MMTRLQIRQALIDLAERCQTSEEKCGLVAEMVIGTGLLTGFDCATRQELDICIVCLQRILRSEAIRAFNCDPIIDTPETVQ